MSAQDNSVDLIEQPNAVKGFKKIQNFDTDKK